ncbi:MAG: hypothetical protein Q9174_001245 [Haloplaca sp. 1 TL-2023]
MSLPFMVESGPSDDGKLEPDIEQAPFGYKEMDVIVMFRLVPPTKNLKPVPFTLISYFLNGLCDKQWTATQVFRAFTLAREAWNNKENLDTYGCFNRWLNEYKDETKRAELDEYYSKACETFRIDYKEWYRNEDAVSIDTNLERRVCDSIPTEMFTPWPFLLKCLGPRTVADKLMDEAIDTKDGSEPSMLLHYNAGLTAVEMTEEAFQNVTNYQIERERFFARLKAERRTREGQPEIPTWFTNPFPSDLL